MATKNDKIDKPSPVNHAMAHGIELGVFFGLKFILSARGTDSMWLNALYFLLTVYIIYGIFRIAFNYRMTVCGGEIGYWQAFRYIVCLFFFSAIVAAMIRIVYLEWFDSAFFGRMTEQFMQVLKQLNMTEAERTSAEEALRMALRPVRFSLYYIFYDILLSVPAALILAPLVKIRIYNRE